MISVCIATYNGAHYIKAQLDSILSQISDLDEIIVCDDQSSDGTIDVITAYNDPRIKIYRNETRLGHVRNFERALSLAEGDYIFLSDQDDVWLPGRVDVMVSKLETNPKIALVASNFDLIDANGGALGVFKGLGPVKTPRAKQVACILMGRAPYFGCTFLMRRSLLNRCMPIPKGVESHDIWIALIASLAGSVFNLETSTLQHRIHGRNVTTEKRRALFVILKSRCGFLKALVSRLISLRFGKIGSI